jgi:lipopolysaccharide transport system ATP-binding protein
VSHDAGSIERVCDRVIVLDGGRVEFDGPTAEALLHYHRLMGTEQGGGESLRPGTDHALQVSDVELRDGAGRPSSVFPSRAPLQAIVAVRARRQTEAPILALELRAQDGTQVYRTTHPFELDPDGTAQLAFEIPSLNLLGGDYDLAAGAGHRSEAALIERTIRFSVAREPGDEGIVALGGEWRSMPAKRELEP